MNSSTVALTSFFAIVICTIACLLPILEDIPVTDTGSTVVGMAQLAISFIVVIAAIGVGWYSVGGRPLDEDYLGGAPYKVLSVAPYEVSPGEMTYITVLELFPQRGTPITVRLSQHYPVGHIYRRKIEKRGLTFSLFPRKDPSPSAA